MSKVRFSCTWLPGTSLEKVLTYNTIHYVSFSIFREFHIVGPNYISDISHFSLLDFHLILFSLRLISRHPRNEESKFSRIHRDCN